MSGGFIKGRWLVGILGWLVVALSDWKWLDDGVVEGI